MKQKSDSLADTIRRLAATFENTIGDFKVKKEVTIGEPRNGRYDRKKMGLAGGLWCHNGDPYSHVIEYKRWKTALLPAKILFPLPFLTISLKNADIHFLAKT